MESSSSDADGTPATKKARLSDCAANSANTIMADLPNPHLENLDSDFLYHIGYSGKDCIETFKDVSRYVCPCRSGNRARTAAQLLVYKYAVRGVFVSLDKSVESNWISLP